MRPTCQKELDSPPCTLKGGGTKLILGYQIFGTVLPTTQPILDGIEQTLHQWKQLDVLYQGVQKNFEKYYDVIGEFPPKN